MKVEGSVRTEGVIGMMLLPPFLLLLCWFLSLFGRSMPFTMFGLSACLLAVIVALVLDELYSRGPLVNEELQNRFWGYVTFFSKGACARIEIE